MEVAGGAYILKSDCGRGGGGGGAVNYVVM